MIVKTKINKQRGSAYWRLFVEVDGKYKVKFKSEDKKEVVRRREALRHNLFIKETYTDVRIDDELYNKLTLVKKYLKHNTFNKTIKYLIDQAFNDYAKQQISLEKQPH
tara:strand:- start:734 stop:1057 length:324 start_codon:yes stop_codon:yes gene_type:complete